MESAYQKNSSAIRHVASKHGIRWGDIRLETTGKHTPVDCRLGGKMKVFLTIISLIIFGYNVFNGAVLHTLIDIQHAQNLHNITFIPVDIMNMSLKELTNYRI
jgi:hypothetical protein